MNKEFLKMQKLAGVITEGQYNEKKSLIEIKQITRNDLHDIKAPYSATLENGNEPFPLTDEECKQVEDYSEKDNFKKFLKLSDFGPDTCVLSLANSKTNEKRILKFFKSDKDNYYITVFGPDKSEKYYTTNNKPEFIKFINQVLEEFSTWCDNQ
jgi:hypothetical protein